MVVREKRMESHKCLQLVERLFRAAKRLFRARFTPSCVAVESLGVQTVLTICNIAAQPVVRKGA